jgi:hypothetical protein
MGFAQSKPIAQPPSITYQTMNSAFQSLEGTIIMYSNDENNQIQQLRQQLSNEKTYWKSWCGKDKGCFKFIVKKPIIPNKSHLICILKQGDK